MAFFVRLPEPEMRMEAMAFLSLDPIATRPYLSKTDSSLLIGELSEQEVEAAERSGAKVFTDVRFEHFPSNPLEWRPSSGRYWEFQHSTQTLAPVLDKAPSVQAVGLNEVLQHIQAPKAWERTRGQGVTIAVIDTGICGSLTEFPGSKRSTLDIPSAYSGMHWSDTKGHGSMCATIAAGTAAFGGRFNGVAPDATVLSARTTLYSTDIYKIYDQLVAWKKNGTIKGPLVASNSYGLYTCIPPNLLPQNHPYLQIVLDAIASGITVAFAAGNNHYDVLCNHDPNSCSPNTIWGVNSHDEVLSVGTVNRDETNRDPSTPHANSSRGPGQWAEKYPKPDCVAPTYGEVVWGCGYQSMPWWGTSGACPQVAGLAALLLALDPGLSPRAVGDIIRSSCRPIAGSPTCVGHGIIDCAAAVSMV